MKITQKQLAFYILYKAWKDTPGEYVPAWRCVGEIYIPELNRWEMMSYKCPTRLSDILRENPNLLERDVIRGKSGALYFGYRIRQEVSLADIKDTKLAEFRSAVRRGELSTGIAQKMLDSVK